MRVGTQDVEQTLLLDTGSNQLWVTSVECVETGECDHNFSSTYDLKDSLLGRYRGEIRKENDPDDRTIQILTKD